jgi:hypothetical protein
MMRSRVIRILVLTIVLFDIVNLKVGTPAGEKEYYYKLRISLINNGPSDYFTTLEDRLFIVFPNTSVQQVNIVEASPNVKRILKDEDGNLFAEPGLPERIRPGENVTATILIKINLIPRSLPQFSIDSSGSLSDIPVEFANYTVSSGAWRYESEDLKYIAELAAQIRGNDTNVLRIISKMVKFIGDRVEYPRGEELRPPQYPNQTLPRPGVSGKGDCDDQSALLVTMLRSVGIPSYLQTGGIISNRYSISGDTWDGHLHISSKGIGWHGWVEAYVPPWGWLPVDITYGYSPEEPLYSISKSASARELVLESERYSSIDFVAEFMETEERVKNSSIYIYMEEEIYEETSIIQLIFPKLMLNATILLALTITILSLLILRRSRKTVNSDRKNEYFSVEEEEA